MDYWSYGIICASKKKYLYTPTTNDQLIKYLKEMFGTGELPIVDYGEINGFFNINPAKRMTIASYLKIPEISLKDLSFPIAKNIHHRKDVSYLIKMAVGWAGYFASVDYSSVMNDQQAVELSLILFEGKYKYTCNIHNVKVPLFTLNTFLILLMKYPERIQEFIFPCFVLSIKGTQHPHQKQADWIESLINNKPINSPIKDLYDQLYNLAQQYNLSHLEYKRHN